MSMESPTCSRSGDWDATDQPSPPPESSPLQGPGHPPSRIAPVGATATTAAESPRQKVGRASPRSPPPRHYSPTRQQSYSNEPSFRKRASHAHSQPVSPQRTARNRGVAEESSVSAPPLRHRPPPGMDADMLRRALAFTFPEAPPLGDAEFAMVYRSLDSMQRGYVTLSTFTSVFTPRRADVEKRERARGGGVHAYQALPTWAETVGGYIGDWYLGEDDRERLRKAGVVAAGQFEGPDIGVLARGIAGGFGLGHVWDVEERLGHQLGHAELDALGILAELGCR